MIIRTFLQMCINKLQQHPFQIRAWTPVSRMVCRLTSRGFATSGYYIHILSDVTNPLLSDAVGL